MMKSAIKVLPLSLAVMVGSFALHGASWGEDPPKVVPPKSKLQMSISCSFEEASMTDVARFLREATGANVIYDPPDNEERYVTLQVKDMSVENVLHWVTRLSKLEYTVLRDAIYISSRQNIRAMETNRFAQYDIHDLTVTAGSSLSKKDNDTSDSNNATGSTSSSSSKESTSGSSSSREDVVDVIMLFTGPQNWDHVEVMGTSRRQDTKNNTKDSSE